MAGKSIEAILSLNITQFETGLNSAKSAVNNFKNSLMRWEKDAVKIESGLDQIRGALSMLIPYLNKFKNLVEQSRAFSQFTNGLKNMATAVREFSNVTNTSQVGMIRIKQIIDQWSNAVRNLRVSVDGAVVSEQREVSTLSQLRSSYQSTYMAKERMIVPTQQYAKALEITLPPTRQLITGNRELASSENQVASSTERASASMNRGSASANRMATSTSRLGKAMSSLRMMGTMVGSMLAYNFAHNLAMATNETIQSKSEMEGYFKMLNYGQSDIQRFNDALDQTVKRFQRVNKYSLGETISSIGVEFNLTTDEMIKAMDVTSMITSEYLRAGRNANEASLAVKDVLQGQFQRLSRETGVKGEQLKEAGWNGDVNDVNSLLDALRKVAEDRNWDVFAEKANSLNDIVTILQNRFGEWSADMVNAVQPTIVNAFNSIMSFAQGLAQGLSSLWQWLNTDGWGQTAVKIGLVGTALLTVSQAFASYRTGMSMVQMANMGFTKTLTSVIFGLKGQEMAEMGVRNAILSKVIGVKAETLAESGLASAIAQANTMTQLQTVQNRLNTLSSKENSVAKMDNAIRTDIEKAKKEGLIAVEEADTLRKELNTAMTEANALASLKQAGVNGTLTTSFILLGGAENVAAVATGEISVAMGVLNGVFALSPIGWFMGAVLALAGAFYVLSGGLDSSWDQMKQFNETMENAGDEQKKAQKYLADLKKEVGENSQAYKDAEESVKNWKSELQSASYWMNDSKKKFEEMNLRMSTGSKPILRDLGVDEKEIEEFDATLTHLTLGKNKYYKAEQVLNAQLYNEHSNYNEDLKEYLGNVKKNGGDLQEAYEKMSGNYANLAEHSYIANTTDDWWEWLWNSAYAGMDQFWIDWDKFWANPDFEGAINGLWNQFKYLNPFGNIMKHLGLDNFDLGKSLSETLKGLGDWVDGVGDAWNNFWNNLDLAGAINNAWQGLSDWVSGIDIIGSLMDLIFPKGVSASDGSDHPEVADEMYQVIVQPIVDWWNGFMADPLAYIGNAMQYTGIGSLISALLGSDVLDTSWAWDYLNNNVILPLQTQFNMFLADPLSYIGGVAMGISGIGGLINALIPNDGGASILNYVNTSIIQPFTQGIQTGIASIPILGDIAQMLGLVPQQNENARQTGYNLLDHLKQGVEQKIREIPIIGDIAQMLGLIPQQNGNARDKGHGVGQNIKDGEKQGQQGIAQNVASEMSDVITAISNSIGKAFSTAQQVGQSIWNGINSVLQRASPGFIHDQVLAEFGTDIPNAIASSGETAYSVAQSYGQNIKQGIADAGTTTIGMDGMVSDYESDAQIISDSSQMMGMTTTNAFNDMALSVNSTTSQMQGNVVSSYNAMNTSQTTLLNNMKQKNTSAYNDMYQKSNQSLMHMRDSTSNITHQMTNAWNLMKNNIVASAHQLQHDSTVHFNTLSNTIGSFYRKIQNPSNWGAGPSSNSRTSRRPSVGRRIGHALHGAGPNSGGNYRGSSTMTISQLKKVLCPNGDCDGIFDGYAITDRVNVQEFINSITGEHGFGGWSGWNNTHYSYIKNKSDQWGMKSPTIQLAGGIPTSASFKVGDFESGSPKISFSEFESMARAIFTTIPYKHYYDSSWKGSWLGALQAGACNCSDGADAIIAFASACGFGGGQKVHGTWDGEGHFWAVINGKVFDTTAMQQRGSWTSSAVKGYGPPTRTAIHTSSDSSQQPKIEVVVNFNEPVYGVDDLNTQIEEGIDKGLQKHFNKSYAIGI